MEQDGANDEIRATLLEHGYELLDPVGSGAFATVFTVRNLRYSDTFCVKVIDVATSEDKLRSRVNSFNSEITSLMKLTHPNIVSIFDQFQNGDRYYLIIEYCPNGSLTEMLAKERYISGTKLYEMTKQLVKAMAYCHSCNICHRDIKPQNILIDQYLRPKLADFGLAKLCTENNHRTLHFCGSIPYMSPELIAHSVVDPFACDVWALGVTFFEMITGELPWTSRKARRMEQEIAIGAFTIPSYVEPRLQQVLRRMLDPDPMRRSTMASVLELPFFKTSDHRVASCQSNLTALVQTCSTPVMGNRGLAVSHTFGGVSPTGSGVFSKKRTTRVNLVNASLLTFSPNGKLELPVGSSKLLL